MRWGHGLYFGKVVPRIGGLLSDGPFGHGAGRDAYRYLPRSVEYLPEPDTMVGMLRGAGFDHVERRLLTGGIAQLLLGTRA
jgi:demethylmenaquinone methyltransferase/2-methoxy-6-polyprenyl-1,4-benzoquinol methylase